MNGLQLLASIAPWLAIIGFVFILIKSFVSKDIKKIMCIHLIAISVMAFICYMIRYSVTDNSLMSFFTGLLWVVIGALNVCEYSILKDRHS